MRVVQLNDNVYELQNPSIRWDIRLILSRKEVVVTTLMLAILMSAYVQVALSGFVARLRKRTAKEVSI